MCGKSCSKGCPPIPLLPIACSEVLSILIKMIFGSIHDMDRYVR